MRQQKIARIRLFSGSRAILTTRLRSLSVAQRPFIETGAFCCRATDERKPGVKVLRTVLREIVDSKYVPSNGSEEFCSVFFLSVRLEQATKGDYSFAIRVVRVKHVFRS